MKYTREESLRLEALRIAAGLKETESYGASNMFPSGHAINGKTAERLVADATKIYAFLNAPKQIKRK